MLNLRQISYLHNYKHFWTYLKDFQNPWFFLTLVERGFFLKLLFYLFIFVVLQNAVKSQNANPELK